MYDCLDVQQSGIAQGGGLTQTYHSSAEQYSSGFSLALRMISVAAGVTIGLFVSQVIGQYDMLWTSSELILKLTKSTFSVHVRVQHTLPFNVKQQGNSLILHGLKDG